MLFSDSAAGDYQQTLGKGSFRGILLHHPVRDCHAGPAVLATGDAGRWEISTALHWPKDRARTFPDSHDALCGRRVGRRHGLRSHSRPADYTHLQLPSEVHSYGKLNQG